MKALCSCLMNLRQGLKDSQSIAALMWLSGVSMHLVDCWGVGEHAEAASQHCK